MNETRDINRLLRFHGLRIDYRSHGTEWPHKWRLKLIASKNEREAYGFVLFADSFDELIAKGNLEMDKENELSGICRHRYSHQVATMNMNGEQIGSYWACVDCGAELIMMNPIQIRGE